VPQDPNDEQASELLKRIQVEKKRVINGRVSIKSRSKALQECDSPTFPIPEAWIWSNLAAVGFINPRNAISADIDVSFISMSMIPAKYGAINKHETRMWGEVKSGFTHFSEGDVGLAKITPCFENGKSTVFKGLQNGYGAGTTELHIVRPVLVDAYYVLIYLKSPGFVDEGIGRMTGTAGQKRVSTDYFSLSPFPLPPLAEQHRIVAKVDELMTICDELDAQLKTTEADGRRFLEAVLRDALEPTGTLLPCPKNQPMENR
jgi:type I restriction enzyme S subunit